MRIDPLSIGNLNAAPETTGASSTDKGASASSAGGDTSSSLNLSAELQQLLANVRQMPEVRVEAVLNAMQRLAGGDYLTPDAAAQTAAALLNGQ